jgi:hypothetical protein
MGVTVTQFASQVSFLQAGISLRTLGVVPQNDAKMAHLSRIGRSILKSLSSPAVGMHRAPFFCEAMIQKAPLTPASIQAALNQAKQARRRGKHRKAMLLMRKAAFEGRENPTLWNRYALSCLRDGRTDEAQKAFAHSIWLDRRQGNHRRAQVTTELAERALRGDLNH